MIEKSSQPGGFSDQQLEIIVGYLLRTGVVIAAMVVLMGGVLLLTRHGGTHVDYRTFHGEPAALRHVSGIISGALHGQARAVIQLGLLLLIATPVARVVLCAIGFSRERDYRYVVITLIVLAVLSYSLFHSI